MPNERQILEYEPPQRRRAGVTVLRIVGIILCLTGIVYGVLFIIGSTLGLWHLVRGNHSARYWAEDVRGNIGFILIGLVLGGACTRWLLGILQRVSPAAPPTPQSPKHGR